MALREVVKNFITPRKKSMKVSVDEQYLHEERGLLRKKWMSSVENKNTIEIIGNHDFNRALIYHNGLLLGINDIEHISEYELRFIYGLERMDEIRIVDNYADFANHMEGGIEPLVCSSCGARGQFGNECEYCGIALRKPLTG